MKRKQIDVAVKKDEYSDKQKTLEQEVDLQTKVMPLNNPINRDKQTPLT